MQEYIIEKCKGIETRRKAERHNCKLCNKSFLRRMHGLTKMKYCSRECYNLSSRKRVEVICFQCGKIFNKTKSKSLCNKHGFHFCSRSCKEIAQSLDGKCVDIRPLHYGTGTRVYADIAFRNLPNECCGCGDKTEYLLVVHHKDGDRENSCLDNLEIVCCNCHAKRHLRVLDDKWVFDSRALTPRERLIDL